MPVPIFYPHGKTPLSQQSLTPRSAGGPTVQLPDMVALPGGAFLMGSDAGRADERPVHEVEVSPFALARYPVTNTEYACFLAAVDWAAPVEWGRPGFDVPDAPVCGVSWHDAVRYCAWLNEMRNGDEERVRYHLPTEAQQEYAARGGAPGMTYPWGDEEPPRTGAYARGQAGPQIGRPMRVGTVPFWPNDPPADVGPAPGRFGVYNLADNVHEWCADFYQPDYYASAPRLDPPGPATSKRRVATAGSWRHDRKFARNAARSSLAPQKRFADFGFRVARSRNFRYVGLD